MDPENRRRALAQQQGLEFLSKYKYLKHNPSAGGMIQSFNIPQSSSNKSSKNRLHRLGIDFEVDVESTCARHVDNTFWGTSNALRHADISCSQLWAQSILILSHDGRTLDIYQTCRDEETIFWPTRIALLQRFIASNKTVQSASALPSARFCTCA